MLVRIAHKVFFYCGLSLFALHVYAQSTPKAQVSEPIRWLDVSLSPEALQKASAPIGSLQGRWLGEWEGFQVEVNHDANPSTLTLTAKGEKGSTTAQRVVVTAEYSRKGRLITVAEVSCLKQVSQRQWILTRQSCPVLNSGQLFELLRGKDQQWSLQTGNVQIALTKG
jgi:hypothetical protein